MGVVESSMRGSEEDMNQKMENLACLLQCMYLIVRLAQFAHNVFAADQVARIPNSCANSLLALQGQLLARKIAPSRDQAHLQTVPQSALPGLYLAATRQIVGFYLTLLYATCTMSRKRQ